MIGEALREEAVHFLLLGNSREHIIEAIERFEIRRAVLFTSTSLKDKSLEFAEEMKGHGVNVLELVTLDPFEACSLEKMTGEIMRRYQFYGRANMIIAGLTGGTNLMAISMALAALLNGSRCHYIAKREDGTAIEINIFERLNKAGSIEAMTTMIREVAD